MRVLLTVIVLLLWMHGVHAAEPGIPPNVTTKLGPYNGQYLDAVDFSVAMDVPVDFAQVKLCVAQTVENRGVALRDSSGSFVGSATGTYYHVERGSTAAGGDVFKFVDDKASALVATGTVDGGRSTLGLVHDFVKFDLTATAEDRKLGLVFRGVERAQQNTGNLANDGFQPVGVWRGSRYKQVYDSLNALAIRLVACSKA